MRLKSENPIWWQKHLCWHFWVRLGKAFLKNQKTVLWTGNVSNPRIQSRPKKLTVCHRSDFNTFSYSNSIKGITSKKSCPNLDVSKPCWPRKILRRFWPFANQPSRSIGPNHVSTGLHLFLSPLQPLVFKSGWQKRLFFQVEAFFPSSSVSDFFVFLQLLVNELS